MSGFRFSYRIYPLEFWEGRRRDFKDSPYFWMNGWGNLCAWVMFGCVLIINIFQVICPGIRITVNKETLWQEFIYEKLLEIYIIPVVTSFQILQRHANAWRYQRSKPVYGPWTRTARVRVYMGLGSELQEIEYKISHWTIQNGLILLLQKEKLRISGLTINNNKREHLLLNKM